MNIVFVLPRSGSRPIGGFKVVYEYAGEIARRGHRVRIIHPALMRERKSYSPAEFFLKSTARYWKGKLSGSWTPNTWFCVDPSVEMRWVRAINEDGLKDADVVVATHWATAEAIAALNVRQEKRVYLIQGFESWNGPEERVEATWRLPYTKVVIARWLSDLATKMGEKSVYIPNGLDFSRFNCVVPIDTRPKSVAMMAHSGEWKGTADGLKALLIAKEKWPALTAELFGVSSPPSNLPSWIKYHRQPSQDELKMIYNNSAIFLAPSLSEGWPLPPAEAMMCGAAVIGTEIGGHLEYMQHGVTALLSPVRSPELLAENILRLLQNDEERRAIAKAGNRFIQKFTWCEAADKLEGLFLQLSQNARATSVK